MELRIDKERKMKATKAISLARRARKNIDVALTFCATPVLRELHCTPRAFVGVADIDAAVADMAVAIKRGASVAQATEQALNNLFRLADWRACDYAVSANIEVSAIADPDVKWGQII